jgi:indolepyruvate ferredoxin oxidoreductase
VDKVHAAERGVAGSGTRLSEAVARYLFKLMAYKDEYEVARLHTDGAFSQRIAGMFEGDYRVVHHLAPPSSARKDEQGHLVKKAYGPWMHKAMEVLAKMKGLRGTALDPFGRTEERRTERALIQEYRQCIKERNLAAARTKWKALLARWSAPARGAAGTGQPVVGVA